MRLSKLIWENCKKQILKKAENKKNTAFTNGSLVFIITTKCDFFCKHCLRDLQKARDLPLEIAEKVIRGAKKYHFSHISLTGGEPLLYPFFEELVESLSQNNYRFAVITNGYNFSSFADFFKKYRPRISFIGFSVESINKKEHDALRRPGSFEKLLESFSICRRLKIPFRILTAASLMNHDELFEIALFAKKKGADALVMTTVLPCPNSESNKLVLDATKRKEVFLLLKELPRIIRLPVLIAADIRANSNIALCRALELKEVTLDVDGNLVQCCEVGNFDNEDISRKAIVASVKDRSFDDALKILLRYIHDFNCQRIEDYKTQSDTDDIDFSSCFYCLRRLEKNRLNPK
jgi:MoaA/NifB/PqqE/SkfB family radical SAM enzyme